MSFMLTVIGCKEEVAEEVEEVAEEVEEAAEEVGEVETKQDFTGVTLTFWMNSASPQAYRDLYDRFQEDTGIMLEIIPSAEPMEETMLAKWASGERPDIMDWHMTGNWWVQINAPENCQDISDLPFVDNYKPEYEFINEQLFPDGKIYGVNFAYPHIIGVAYNKEIFKDLNLQIPGNFSEFQELCETIKEAGITPLYAGVQDQWPLQFDVSTLVSDYYKEDPVSFWEKMNTGETNYLQPAFLEPLEAVQSNIDAGYYQDNMLVGTFADAQTALYEGEVAMFYANEQFPQILSDNYGIDEVNKKIGMFGLSMNSNCVTWGLWSPGAAITLPKTGDATREAAAREFVNYITGLGYEKFATDLNLPSVFKGVEVDVQIEPIAELIEYFVKDSGAYHPMLVDAPYGTFELWLSEMFAGSKTPKDVAQSLSDALAENAKKLGLPGWENK